MKKEKQKKEKTKKSHKLLTFFLVVVFLIAITIGVCYFLYVSIQKSGEIVEGVYIKGNNVSGLNQEQAYTMIKNALRGEMPETVVLTYKNEKYYVEVEQIEAKFDLDKAINDALLIGRKGDIIDNIKEMYELRQNAYNIEPKLEYNAQALSDYLDTIQTQLPDQLEQSSYYIEDGDLIITNGHLGAEIIKEQLEDQIIANIRELRSSEEEIEIPTNPQYPDGINVGQIHDEVYKKMENAYFTKDPYMVYPDVTGVDFDVNSVVKMLQDSPHEDEWKIALTYTKPEVTVQDLGDDAFPDLLADFSTKYVNNPDRTTNLRLAANKVNGTVIMPGEIFSYNKIVGKRTVAAGYKEAAIYENGQVVDGVGGGICQISTTIYNAAVEANMEIVERRNHQFVPSYVSGGYDATVAWGSTDFRFQNTRNYPIKIEASVSGGIANVKIYGLLTDDEYDISITTKTVKSTSTSLVVDSFKVYKRNGEVVNTEKLYRDTYKKH